MIIKVFDESEEISPNYKDIYEVVWSESGEVAADFVHVSKTTFCSIANK